MRTLVAVALLVAALVAPAAGMAVVTETAGHSVAGWSIPAPALGDDNADGVIDEDESGWVCWTMGNARCGLAPLGHAGRA